MDINDSKTSVLWFALTLPALAQLLAACLFYTADGVPPASRCLGTAVCVLTVAYFLWPMLWHDGSVNRLGPWCAMTAAAALLLTAAVTPVAQWAAVAAPLTGGVLTTAFLLGSLTAFVHRVLGLAARTIHRGTLIAFVLTTTLPVWLGPVAGALAAQGFTDLIIAASPVGYLTALIDYDVLRSGWFYTNTPLGGLRYDYPDPVIMTAVYCGSGVLLLFGGTLRRRVAAPRRDAALFASFHSAYKEPTT
jgi:hypothetical protein